MRQWRSPVRTSKLSGNQEIRKSRNQEIKNGKFENGKRVASNRNTTRGVCLALVAPAVRQGHCRRRARRPARTLSPSRPPSGKAGGAIAMQTKEIHPKTKLREEKSDLKKEERIGVVMHQINKPHALYDHIWTPIPAHDPRTRSGRASPSCTAGGITDTSAIIGHLIQLTTAVKTLDELCKLTRSTDVLSLRNRAISLLAEWTHALDQQVSLCVREVDRSATAGGSGV